MSSATAVVESCIYRVPVNFPKQLRIVLQDKQLSRIDFVDDIAAKKVAEVSVLPAPIKLQLDQYFLKNKAITLAGQYRAPLTGTDFQNSVWQMLTSIPYGQTISYSELACRVGRPKAVRAVASACRNNPLSILFPCHRVVAKNGALTGFAGGLSAKAWLLAHEGVDIEHESDCSAIHRRRVSNI